MPNPNTVEPATREAQELTAVELRTMGMSYRAIAQHLGVAPQTAHKRVHDGLAREWDRVRPAADQYRTLQLQRCQEAAGAAMVAILRDGNMSAIAGLVKLMEREARLLGLDQPVQVEVADALTADIRNLAAELGVTEQVSHILGELPPGETDGDGD